MRKKILMLMACGCLLAGNAHAQWVVTDPTNLAQSIINTTKEIVQTSKTVKNTLDNFKEVEKLCVLARAEQLGGNMELAVRQLAEEE